MSSCPPEKPVETSIALYLKALRPHQWLKNALLFLPALAAHDFTAILWAHLALAFVCFSLAASATYIVNDLKDIEHDRLHPVKCKRPFASGALSAKVGLVLAAACFALSVSLSAFLSYSFVGCILLYLALTTFYSFYFKRVVIMDVVLLSCLYTLRVLSGGVAADIMVSPWLLGFCIFLFFCLALVKRLAEVQMLQSVGKDVLSGRAYITKDGPLIESMAASSGLLSVLVLALYIESPAVAQFYNHPEYLWGCCLVLLYEVGRILILAHRGEIVEDPVLFATKDRASILAFILFLFILFAGAWRP